MNSKPWTVMVYMVADDSDGFYAAAEGSMCSMKAGVPKDNINVVVHLEAPKIEESRVVTLRNGVWEKAPRISPTEQVGDFVRACAKEYEASRYLLVLWGHGQGIGWKRKFSDKVRSVAALFPGPDGGGLSVQGVAHELNGTSIAKENLIVGFDACLMGMVEVYYELARDAEWVVAGADEIPVSSWPYENILERLVNEPNIDAEKVTTAIVDECADWYSRYQPHSRVSLSATKLDQSTCESLVHAVRNLADELAEHVGEGSIRNAVNRARAHAADYSEKAYSDLHAFCSKLAEEVKSDQLSDVRVAAAEVATVLNKAVTHSRFSGGYAQSRVDDSRAVTICLPKSATEVSSGTVIPLIIDWDSYKRLAFTEQTSWYHFLEAFWDTHVGATNKSFPIEVNNAEQEADMPTESKREFTNLKRLDKLKKGKKKISNKRKIKSQNAGRKDAR